MTTHNSLLQFGLSPTKKDLSKIKEILGSAVRRERSGQSEGDTELMKLCCVQLFCAGQLEDVLDIWGAKISSMDSDASIDIQLLCGAGLQQTKAHLRGVQTTEATAALQRLEESEREGDLEGFSVSEYSMFWLRYYNQTGLGLAGDRQNDAS